MTRTRSAAGGVPQFAYLERPTPQGFVAGTIPPGCPIAGRDPFEFKFKKTAFRTRKPTEGNAK